jgi:DNA-binding NtrC family response regulator
MPSRIVVVHDDADFVARSSVALTRSGYGGITFTDPTAAFPSLMAPHHVEMLITRVHFGFGKLNGITMALMCCERRPLLEIIFVSFPQHASQALLFGEFVPMPVRMPNLMAVVTRLMPPPPLRAA